MKKIGEPKRPQGIIRLLYRLPLSLYRLGLGVLMGGRFIHLIHIGRKSGLRREAVIEVIESDSKADVYYLASAWGDRSDWYLNILLTAEVEAQVGGRRFYGRAEKIHRGDAAEVFSGYGRRHPRTLQTLARVMGYQIEAKDEDYRALGDVIPVVAIQVEDEIAKDRPPVERTDNRFEKD
jgi:deazaflavin-dependent oxidoreductase (nitroreductase family)